MKLHVRIVSKMLPLYYPLVPNQVYNSYRHYKYAQYIGHAG